MVTFLAQQLERQRLDDVDLDSQEVRVQSLTRPFQFGGQLALCEQLVGDMDSCDTVLYCSVGVQVVWALTFNATWSAQSASNFR